MTIIHQPADPAALWRASFATCQPSGCRHCYSHPVGKAKREVEKKANIRYVIQMHLPDFKLNKFERKDETQRIHHKIERSFRWKRKT